tara:strand:- start:804 stop:1664 length:861 start_codon:yes stop_codon:yes gene_type:complete
MSKVKKVTRKTFTIRKSGRSSDYITPSFGYGCLYNCSYCYMKRHLPNGLSIANNANDILTSVNNHAMFAEVEKPNQTHSEYITYDISCNEDFALHAKHHNWEYIFKFFRDHPTALGTFATKTIPIRFLDFNPEKKIRIRFSLMPQNIADRVEPYTAEIIDRIKAVDAFIEAGYEVHLNFSPVIVYKNWIEDYKLLFEMCNDYIENKEEVLAEVIFLTHNKDKHYHNLRSNTPGEELLWVPEIQEPKLSQYGGRNIRYKHQLKSQWIDKWLKLHDNIVPWNKVRYIF